MIFAPRAGRGVGSLFRPLASSVSLAPLASFAVLVGAATALTGCPDAASSPEGACEAYVNALDGYLVRCAPHADGDGIDREGVDAECRLAATLPGTGATPERIAEAAEKVESAACSDDLEDVLPNRGSLATGAACLASIQCAGYCDTPEDTPGGCGTCAAFAGKGASCRDARCDEGLDCVDDVCVDEPARVKEGEVCYAPGDTSTANLRCAEGLVCDVRSVGGEVRCAKRGGEGATCTSSELCAAPLGCVDGACRAPGKAGAKCSDERSCGRDTGCVDGTCVALTYAEAGAACDGERVRCRVTYCARAGSATEGGTCARIAGEGEACGDEAVSCGKARVCRDGACRTVDPNACK